MCIIEDVRVYDNVAVVLGGVDMHESVFINCCFFFSARGGHTSSSPVSWARRCV